MASNMSLTTCEQVSRGQELLQILKEQPVTSVSCESGRKSGKDEDVDVKVLVKRTFIDVVDPREKEGRTMNRSMSDSALFDFASRSERIWQKISSDDKLNKLNQDMSDASTNDNISNDGEDSGAESAVRKDTCWSDDEGAMEMYMQPYMPCQYMEQWWVPMSFDPSTNEWVAMDGAGSFMPQQWADVECENVEGGADQEWRTTVMLRNMPNNYTRDMLLELVDSMGFEACYDFAYLPVDFKSQAGLGYAFINFVSSELAQRCFDDFEGYSEWKVPSEKVCTVTWGSPYQGLEAHIERYQNSPVMHHSIPDEWKPVLFGETGRIEFPAPTKPIKTPKVRQQPAN